MFSTILFVLRQTLSKAIKDNIIIFGGYAAYTSLLAFFPFIIFLMALAGLLGDAEISGRLIAYGLTYLPAEIMETIAPAVTAVMEYESPGLLTLGGLGTLWVITSGVEGLRFGLNTVYAVKEFRPLWKRRLQSLGVVFAGGLAFVLLMLAVIIWPLISRFMFISLEDLAAINILRFLLAFLLIALLSVLYRILPHRPQRWRDVWPGAFLATFLWLSLAQLFSLYLSHFGRMT